MSEAPIYPTAHEVAVAIVAATRLHDEDPVLTVEGATSCRGRWLAMAALFEAFPDAPYRTIAAWCGVLDRTRNANSRAELAFKRKHAGTAKGCKWWSEIDLEDVKSDLAAAIAETDAKLRSQSVDFDLAPKSEPAPADLPRQASAVDGAGTPNSVLSPLFGGIKSDVLDTEEPDFSHLRDAPDRPAVVAPTDPAPAKVISPTAHALASFHRSRIDRKIAEAPSGAIPVTPLEERIAEARSGKASGRSLTGLLMGDPPPSRSALDQRGAI